MRGMTGKVLLLALLLVILGLSGIAGFLLYYFSHPAATKTLIENQLGRRTGTVCTIDSLSYSLKPLRIEVRGLRLEPPETRPGILLDLAALSADFTLTGSFGSRSLVLHRLQVAGLTLNLQPEAALPRDVNAEGDSSLWGRTIRRAVGFLLFRDVQLRQAELSGGRVNLRSGEQRLELAELEATLVAGRPLQMAGSAVFRSDGEGLFLSAPRFELETDGELSLLEPLVAGRLSAGDIDLRSPWLHAKKTRVEVRFRYAVDERALAFQSLDLRLEATRIPALPALPAPLPLRLASEGRYDFRRGELALARFEADVARLLNCRGSLRGHLGPQKTALLRLTEARIRAAGIPAFLPPALKAFADRVALDGDLLLAGQVDGRLADGKGTLGMDLEVRLANNPLRFMDPDFRLGASLQGTARARGTYPDIRVDLQLAAPDAFLSRPGLEVRPSALELRLSGQYPAFQVDRLDLRIPQVALGGPEKPVILREARIQQQGGSFDLREIRLSVPKISLTASSLGTWQLALQGDRESLSAEFSAAETNLTRFLQETGRILPSWRIEGLSGVSGRLQLKTGGQGTFDSRVAFSGLRFEGPDGSRAGENLKLQAAAQGRFHLGRSTLEAELSVSATEGEVLWERFYLDLSRHPFQLTARGAADIPGRRVDLTGLQLGLAGLLGARLQGTLADSPRDRLYRVSLEVPEVPAAPLFQLLVKEPFQTSVPLLAELAVGGAVSATVELTGERDDWGARGQLRWQSGALSGASVELQGVELDFPLAHGTANARLEPLQGSLRIRSVRVPGLPDQPLALRLEATPGSLFLVPATPLLLPGGQAELAAVLFRDLLTPHFSVTTALSVSHLDLQPLFARLWPQPVTGTLSGKLDPVVLSEGTLKTSGELHADVFGGRLIVSDVGVSGFPGPAPTLEASARWQELDLSEITTGTEFGKIEGRLNGHLRNLELAFGQPQRFDLLLESVPRPGVAQRISVRAVDNIAFIGGGQSPFVGLAGTLASLFKTFPYERIGVRAALQNDVFRINGTIREDGKEYLVKKGGFSGVNVVNQNPDNRISFKDMVKRIKRISDRKGGPVVMP